MSERSSVKARIRAAYALLWAPWAWFAFDRMNRAGADGDWTRVIDCGNKLLRLGYRGPRVHFLLGMAHLNFERPQEAVEQFERVRRRLREGDHPNFVYSHALALAKLDRLEEARRMLEAESVAQWPEVLRTRSEQLLKVVRDRGAR